MTFPSINPEDVGVTGLLYLVASYGFVLFKSSELIAHGSELLLLIPSLAGIVGGVVLPLMGSVPDAAIMLFSGLGDKESAQESISVGVGALAGSTIMVLTVPFGMSILAGLVDLTENEQKPNYYGRPKLSDGKTFTESLFGTGIAVSPAINKGVFIMMMTTIPYFVIEIPLLLLPSDDTDEQIAEGEYYWAWLGFGVCLAGFFRYLKVQFDVSKRGDDDLRRMAVMKKLLSHGTVSLRGALYDALLLEEKMEQEAEMHNTYKEMLDDQSYYTSAIVIHYLEEVLKEPFHKYDRNGTGYLDKSEVRVLFKDMNEDISPEKMEGLFDTFDRNKSGTINYGEFCEVMYAYMKRNFREMQLPTMSYSSPSIDNDEEEEMPSDLTNLSPEEQQRAIKKRAFSMLAVGSFLVVLFSDPTVEVITEISNRLNISPFYVSFILVPFASNLTEVISSIYYSSKKTSKSMTVALSSLSGAAAMNNTLCLSLFMGLIVFRGIAWEYTAETIAIVVVQFIVGYFASKSKMRKIEGYIILSLYPLSILLVAGLEALGMQ